MNEVKDDGWIMAAECLPQVNQEIDAKIMYMGKVSVVTGKVMPDRKSVLFRFWNADVGAEILEWRDAT